MKRVDFAGAVQVLKAGAPLIFPTDTVVGLGVAVAYSPSPQALFDLKGRPAAKPVAWLVADDRALGEYGLDISQCVHRAIASRWPGAFTAVVKASASVPEAYCSREGTIGLRVPNSEAIRELILRVGSPLATTSANLAGQAAPIGIDGVSLPLLERVAVFDSREQGGGAASTVVDFTSDPPKALR